MHDDVNVIAGYFVDVPDIDVARIDISKNDIPGIEMKSYPMFVMYPAVETKRMGKTLEKRADLGVGDGRGIES